MGMSKVKNHSNKPNGDWEQNHSEKQKCYREFILLIFIKHLCSTAWQHQTEQRIIMTSPPWQGGLSWGVPVKKKIGYQLI